MNRPYDLTTALALAMAILGKKENDAAMRHVKADPARRRALCGAVPENDFVILAKVEKREFKYNLPVMPSDDICPVCPSAQAKYGGVRVNLIFTALR